MTEWHLPPDYIIDNWTDEQLELYVEKLVERKKRENMAFNRKIYGGEISKPDQVVSQFREFRAMGSKVKVVKK